MDFIEKLFYFLSGALCWNVLFAISIIIKSCKEIKKLNEEIDQIEKEIDLLKEVQTDGKR